MERAEFDRFADEYDQQLRAKLLITGEGPEYFSKYKIDDLAGFVSQRNISSRNIFDFGSGIGNSLPFLRKYFPASEIRCGDVSIRSIEIARKRFPGHEIYVQIEANRIPVADRSQDIVFTACVFHHIPHEEHVMWLKELRRITKSGGVLMVYEHNPMNPLTVRTVHTCPFDVNARLIWPRALCAAVSEAGWGAPKIAYRVFFPHSLAELRPLERRLGWLFLGAQYRLTAVCPA
jgi:ubiquinone/menaquinone biosynthesis C-methylase UbiE